VEVDEKFGSTIWTLQRNGHTKPMSRLGMGGSENSWHIVSTRNGVATAHLCHMPSSNSVAR